MLRATILAIGLLALILAPGASASTAEMWDSYLVYRADEGEANVLSIVHSDDGLITVTDTGAVIQATNGCVSKDIHVAECGHPSLPEGSDLHWHSVSLGDQDDSFEVFGLEPGVLTDYLARGEAGDDALLGGHERDDLSGGDGSDRLDGGGGDDILIGGSGSDLMRGGLGTDTASYYDTVGGVRVEIGDGPGDGEPGEGDDVQTENVVGGAGDDVLIGNFADNELEGGPGTDFLSGAKGDDELVGLDAGVSGDALASDRMRCGTGLDTAVLSGPDIVRDTCEQLAHDTSMRIRLTELVRVQPRRIAATVKRVDSDYGAGPARAQFFVPCGPVRDDGTRCWRRVGRSHSDVVIDRGDSGVIEVVLSHAGRRWVRDHPRRRARLTVLTYAQDFPNNAVELRVRVRVPRA